MGPKFRGAPKAKPAQSALVAKAQAKLTQAVALHKQGRLVQAKQIYEEILKSNPSHFDALHFMGLIALQEKDYLEAADLLTKAIEINPKSAAACYNQGIILFELKQFEAALQSYDKAIILKPDYAEAYSNRGNSLKELLQFEAALQSYDKAISLKPDYAEAYSNRGIVLMKFKRYEAAVESYDKAIAFKPEYSEFYFNRGNAFKELKQFGASLESYAKAVALKPGYAEAYSNRGNVFKELKQFEAALESFDSAIELKPDSPDLYLNRGAALVQFKKPDLAIDSFFKAISLKPDFADAYNNLGHAYSELLRYEKAVSSYEQAFSLEPDFDYLLGMLIYIRMNLCDWVAFDKSLVRVLEKVQSSAKVIDPFCVLALTNSLPIVRKASEIFSADKHPTAARPMWSGQKYEHSKIRVAYVSCDFRLHPAALNYIGMWERHDRDKFELIAISYGEVYPEDGTAQGQLRTRLVKAFDRFLDVGGKSDEQVARLMQELEVDIAVDISGTMQGGRQGIFAHRPAPVQVNWYGYTSGAPYMDYIVADRVVIPPEHQDGYTEQVVYMPESLSANDDSRQVSDRQFTRSEMGLPESGVVYCSFNNAYKFNPQMFDVWMRVLQQVPGSVLWLQGGGQERVKENLRREASARGVDPERLVFANKLESMAEHLGRHRLADVFLDTLPFNAQTTAVDALWAGLPVLTCLGQSIFGRIAGSVLMALRMHELVTTSLQEYEAHAVRIGLDSGYAKSLKDKLERNSKEAPLFDTARLTRHMERAYERMHERVCQGLGPQAFEVQAQEQDADSRMQGQRRPELAAEITQAQAQAQFNEAVALQQQGQFGHAKEIYERILQGSPRHAQSLHMLGVIAYQTGNHQVAAELIGQAIAINPTDAESYSNRGNALQELKQFEAAVKSYNKAISLKPNLALAFNNRGNALVELRQFEAALDSYGQAINCKRDYADAFNNRGGALNELRKFESAILNFDEAISLKPEFAEAYYNRGNAQYGMRQLEAAVESYERALSLRPDILKAHNNRGNALLELRQFDAALESYERALSVKPDHEYLLGMLLHARMNLCDWKDLDARTTELIQKIGSNAKACLGFNALSLIDSRATQRQAAEIYSQDKYPAAAKPVWSGQRYEHARIRVAYVSCDFKLHPAALNNIGMWERHDRDKFELIAISYGEVYPEDATAQGQMRTRLVRAFDRFLDVGGKSDEQIARMMQELEVDIAVDISGTMQGSRQGIFAHRPAAVQVNLYGYTSGAPYMDYLVADRVVIPPEHQDGYTEQVVYLPESWYPSDDSRQVSSRQFTRSEMGLPESGVVYCSFNNAYKFNPKMFDVWMRVLQQVPGSVLWLQGGGQEKVKENLRREAVARGVDPTRLVFAVKIESMAEHLARHRLADVFLDTLPFNAHTTAVDGLWAGLPVLTCLGQTIPGRVAGSVLMALGMPELVTQDVQAYEAQAVRIGLESGYAKGLKEKLERNKVEAPLFDTTRLTRHMERAYERMHERVCQGLGPQAFEVEPSNGF